MRVLMTTDTVGGVWTFTKELCSGLLDCGCSVTLVSVGRLPTESQLAWSQHLELRAQRRFRFIGQEVPLEWMQGNERAYLDAAPLLMEMASDFGAEVLHTNQYCFGALPLKIPKIVTAHSDVLSWAVHCRGGNLPESEWLKQYRRLVAEGLLATDTVSAPTQWMLDAIEANFRLPKERRVLANGRTVESPVWDKRKLQAVTAGRLWDEAKNIAMLGGVSAPMPILVAGDLHCEWAGSERVLGPAKLLGWLSEDKLLSLFRESAIYICLSQYEPFGLAPLEAALSGCAVIANDIPSLREVWEDDVIYFSGPDELSSLLKKLYEERDMLETARCRSYLKAQKYSRSGMVEGYLDLYEGAISRAREKATSA